LSGYRSKVTPYRVECAQKLRGLILDCGGGLGDYLPFFNAKVILLDRKIEPLRIVNHKNRVNADAEFLPFGDRTFDSVWACAVVQYVHLDPFIREVKRLAKPGGRIFILVPNERSPWDRIKKYLGLETWLQQKEIIKHYTVEDLKIYGRVTGEIQFLPFERFLRNLPHLGHTLMLEIELTKNEPESPNGRKEQNENPT
jgi:SAM-dependent methyltransferase